MVLHMMEFNHALAAGHVHVHTARDIPGFSCAQTLRKFNDISTGSF
jgi:hypothetical protein